MKQISLIIILLCSVLSGAFGQKFAYVDTDYILEQIPEYEEAQGKLDQITQEWQQEIEEMHLEVKKMFNEFQAEQVLLTEEMKKQREEEILKKEREIKNFQKRKFGYEGELFVKRQELIKPIQDKVYDAVQKLAKAKAYDVIFDKSGGLLMLFSNPKYDKSDDVLLRLGYTTKLKK